jgi:hypothetical protein
MTVLSMDSSNPATWDPALDGVHAAPENHAILMRTTKFASYQ